jgi:UDP-2,3-diacylglucosamine pyrophosphatase LpxH
MYLIMYAFIADIHLRHESVEAVSRFISWLSFVKDSHAVYILGDLFDYWYTGMENRFEEVLKALEHPNVHVLKGNRDFLLENLKNTKADIIGQEETIIRIGTTRILLAHGHTLTLADSGFRFLHRFGWPVLEHMDRLLPQRFKDRLANFLVSSSAVVRPSSSSIREGITQEKGVDTVICGHLHRYYTRPGLIVLPAFFDTRQWLSWDESGPNLQEFP